MHTGRDRARARKTAIAAATALLVLTGVGTGRAATEAADAAHESVRVEAEGPTTDAPSPDGMALSGDQDGTVFGSLTVKGEDRVRIEFERPELKVDLDPREAPGLEWGDPLGVLQRSGIDLETPFLGASVALPPRGLADAWTQEYRTGGVVRFRPNLEDVHRWRLEILDARSDTVAVFEGRGNPPDELSWDGVRLDGTPAIPGLAYSYVLIASDKAGNRRTFPGSGFELPPFRLEVDDHAAFLLAGKNLPAGWANRPSGVPPALLLETASRLNQRGSVDDAVEIRAGGRTFEEARTLGEAVATALQERLLGDPSRVRVVTDVRSDAPAGGTIAITSPATRGDA